MKYLFSDFLFFGDALSDFEAAANNNLDFIGLAHSADSVLRGVVSDDMLIKDFTCIVGNP